MSEWITHYPSSFSFQTVLYPPIRNAPFDLWQIPMYVFWMLFSLTDCWVLITLFYLLKLYILFCYYVYFLKKYSEPSGTFPFPDKLELHIS